MLENKNIFIKKKILIYGLGKSGFSSYKFLKNKNTLNIFDDNKILNQNSDIKKKLIKYNDIRNKDFDYIILSPGININNCLLKKYLFRNLKKIRTDLDIFYSLYNKNKNITITGTNGKSTTVQILYEILKKQKFDVRLVGNIGNPILLEKKITKNTLFVIEASSYQLEYSKFFKSNFGAILNITPDHLERHKTLKKYIEAKFKLIENQTSKDFAFLNIQDLHIKKTLKKKNIHSKVIKVNPKIDLKFLKKINNRYFLTDGNKENLAFVIEILKKFNINKKIFIKTLKKFHGLKYRQQIIYKSKKFTIINDSKATSFSSSISLLKSLSNVYWIVGGLAKKGDKFFLSKNNCKTFKVYIFGKDRKFFHNKLKKYMIAQSFKKLEPLLRKVFLDIKNEKNDEDQIILFSPAAASFDNFKNFEERGKYFNNTVKKLINAK
tara:strand:+ start:2508 stop:3815 length:1308 start_codon:yes stop_codon:yes gene_type:complete